MTGVDRAIRVSTAVAVLAVAGVAAYVSYWHAYAVVCAHGETGITARLEPARSTTSKTRGDQRDHGGPRERCGLTFDGIEPIFDTIKEHLPVSRSMAAGWEGLRCEYERVRARRRRSPAGTPAGTAD